MLRGVPGKHIVAIDTLPLASIYPLRDMRNHLNCPSK